MELHRKCLGISLKPPECFYEHLDLFKVLQAGVHECVPGMVRCLFKGWVEHGFFHLRMQRKRDIECHGNPLLDVRLVGRLIALQQLGHPAAIGFKHLNGLGRLDQALMPKEIIVLHSSGLLLGPLSVPRPCSHSARTSRCPCKYTSCSASAVPQVTGVGAIPDVIGLTKEHMVRRVNASTRMAQESRAMASPSRRGAMLPPP